MHKTKNDLPEAIRSQVVSLLDARLADAIDLQTQCKQAHWSVKGPHFFMLHQLFDQVSDDVLGYIDLLAERAVQLGGSVNATARAVAARSKLPEYPLRATTGTEHLEALSGALAAFAKLAREAIESTTRAGDANTADIFTEVSRGTDKWLWIVEAHTQGDR